MNLLWLTDLHFCSEEKVAGVDTKACLEAALGHINQHYADADLCILSGDMVDKGQAGDYQVLRSRLDTLPMPWYPLTGNHDDRSLFREFLPVPDNAMDTHIQYVLPTPEYDIICLDTLQEGSSQGEICELRMAWLIQQIEAAGDKPIYLFMHHPPMTLDLPMQDLDSFRDREIFLRMIAGYPKIKTIFAGHVHRAVCGQVAGIAYATMKSLSVQAPPPYPAWTWDSFKAADEAPNYGVVSLSGDSVNIQFVEFL